MASFHTYRAIEDQHGVFTLFKNNVAAICPKTAVSVPKQSNIAGQMAFVVERNPCNTTCPFATVSTAGGNDEKSIYTIGCEGCQLEIELKELIRFEKKETPLFQIP